MERILNFLQLKIEENQWDHFLIGADWAEENDFPHVAEWLRWMHHQGSVPDRWQPFRVDFVYYWWLGDPSENEHQAVHCIPLPLEEDQDYLTGFSIDYSSIRGAYFAVLECAEKKRILPP